MGEVHATPPARLRGPASRYSLLLSGPHTRAPGPTTSTPAGCRTGTAAPSTAWATFEYADRPRQQAFFVTSVPRVGHAASARRSAGPGRQCRSRVRRPGEHEASSRLEVRPTVRALASCRVASRTTSTFDRWPPAATRRPGRGDLRRSWTRPGLRSRARLNGVSPDRLQVRTGLGHDGSRRSAFAALPSSICSRRLSYLDRSDRRGWRTSQLPLEWTRLVDLRRSTRASVSARDLGRWHRADP